MPRSSASPIERPAAEASPEPPTEGVFCVVCGRTDVATVDGVCADCYARLHPLVEVVQAPTLVLCPTCGARQVGQHWERSGTSALLTAEDLAPFLRPHPEVGIRRVRWEETGANPLVRELTGIVDFRFRGQERTTAVRLQVRLQHHTCPECSRKTGHYYTAVIQLRGLEERRREPSRVLQERLAKAWDRTLPQARPAWKRALSWREARAEGWDVYLTDTLAARSLARFMKGRLSAQLKESASIYGRKDGREVYRVTLLLRIPPDATPSSAPGHRRTERRETAEQPVERHA